jgi:hypothetical protein
MSNQEIIDKIKEKKDFLATNYAISEIGLFGSVARGEDNKKSDIDLMISFENKKKVSLFDLIHIKHYFEDLLGKKIDLVHKPMIRPSLKKQIIKEAILI